MNQGWNRFFRTDECVLALPSWSAPRLLIASYSARQRWQDASAYYPAFRFRAKVFKLLLRLLVFFSPRMFVQKENAGKASKIGCFLAAWLDRRFKSFKHSATGQSLFPSYFHKKGISGALLHWENVPELRGAILAFALENFPEMHRCVVLTGSTAHRKKKMIVQIRSSLGEIVGYLKYGETPEARECIIGEAACLAGLPPGMGPMCLGLLSEKRYACMALSPVQGAMLPARIPKDFKSISSYLKRLEQSQSYTLDEHPAMVRLREQVAALSGDASVPSLSGLERVLEPLSGRQWPLVFQHGDFAPWNVLRIPSSELRSAASGLCAIDWEEGVRDGFPYLDLSYFCLQTGYLMHHWSVPIAVRNTVAILRETYSLADNVARSIVQISALDAWLRNESVISGSELQNFRRVVFSDWFDLEDQGAQ